MRRRQSYFEKRLLLREDSFIRSLGQETSLKRKKSYSKRRLLFGEDSPIWKRDY